jgi:nicotinamidase-related amidase
MSETILDVKTALVLIDLQKGITGRQTAHPAKDIIAKGADLAKAFRAKNLPVVLVNVTLTPNGSWPQVRSDAAPPGGAAAPDFSELVPELEAQPADLRVTKRNWGAFYGTNLDLFLRRLGVTQIVLGGIATSIGVESTARSANEHNYQLTFATDAMTDMSAEAHQNSIERIFPRIGQVRTTADVLAALKT